MAEQTQPEPCGSWRVIREYKGSATEVVWCQRYEGPCPWPDTRENGERACATSGIQRMRVTWAPSCIEAAHVELRAYHQNLIDHNEAGLLTEQTAAVARDALAMCLPEPEEP